jgi:anaerobic selenocysteine-containing dehydrogenase
MTTIAPDRVTDDAIRDLLDTPEDSDDTHAVCATCYTPGDTRVVAVCGAVRGPVPPGWTFTEPVTCQRCLAVIQANSHRCWP